MVYMADDTTVPLPWQDNLNAMEAAAQGPGTSIIALIDLAGFGDSMLLKVQPDTNASQDEIVSTPIDDDRAVIPATGEVNMASSDTLSAFLEFSVDTFPADRFVLVLWGHGSGWRGLCPDGVDFLTLPEIRTSLSYAASHLGRSLDLVVIDACAEATMEMLYEIRGYADYFVAAETNIPNQGLPYKEILDGLADDVSQSPEDLGTIIVDEYISWAAQTSPYSATMALFDLSGFEQVGAYLEQLSAQGVRFDPLFHSRTNSALTGAEQYETEWYADLGDVLDRLQESDIPYEMKLLAIRTALSYKDMVTHFGKYSHPYPADDVWVNRSTGAAIYMPSAAPGDVEYGLLSISGSFWDEFSRTARADAQDLETEQGPTVSHVNTDADAELEAIQIDWPTSYEDLSVWTFRQEVGGFAYIDRATGAGQTITIPYSPEYAGTLVLSTSAGNSGAAESYATVTTTVPGVARIHVELGPEDQLEDPMYDVRVTTTRTQKTIEDVGHDFTITLDVPEEAAVGEAISVELLERGSGDVLATWSAIVPANNSATTMLVASAQYPAEPSEGVLLLFSLLPGALVLAFALMLWKGRAENG